MGGKEYFTYGRQSMKASYYEYQGQTYVAGSGVILETLPPQSYFALVNKWTNGMYYLKKKTEPVLLDETQVTLVKGPNIFP